MCFTKFINTVRQLVEAQSQHHQQKEIQLNSEGDTESPIITKKNIPGK